MGNLSCRRNNSTLSIERDIHQEQEDLQKFLNFNWNSKFICFLIFLEDNKAQFTVEEMVMLNLTNDSGQYITPQVAHIAFTEFKKFMFLNMKYVSEEIEKEKASLKQGETYSPRKHYVGLFAPPVIDNIWSSIISLDVIHGKGFNFFNTISKIRYSHLNPHL